MNFATLNYRAARFLIPRGLNAYIGNPKSLNLYIKSINETGFTYLNNIEVDVSALKEEFLRRVPVDNYPKGNSLNDYVAVREMRGIVRSEPVMATGDCLLSSFATQKALIDLVSEYLQLPEHKICYHVTLDCLFKDSVSLKRADGYDGAIHFHRDVDAWRWLKVFVYLTDVQVGDGEHQIYPGSHKEFPSELSTMRRYTPEELDIYWKCLKVTGPAGTCFAENTLAFHRGAQPRNRSRLALTAVYLDNSVRGIHTGLLNLI